MSLLTVLRSPTTTSNGSRSTDLASFSICWEKIRGGVHESALSIYIGVYAGHVSASMV